MQIKDLTLEILYFFKMTMYFFDPIKARSADLNEFVIQAITVICLLSKTSATLRASNLNYPSKYLRTRTRLQQLLGKVYLNSMLFPIWGDLSNLPQLFAIYHGRLDASRLTLYFCSLSEIFAFLFKLKTFFSIMNYILQLCDFFFDYAIFDYLSTFFPNCAWQLWATVEGLDTNTRKNKGFVENTISLNHQNLFLNV